MRNNRTLLMLIVLFASFDLFAVYVAMTQETFPWAIVALIILISSIILLLLYIFGRQQRHENSGQSARANLLFNIFRGSSVGIVGVMVYDYLLRSQMRWEMYLGFATPTLLLGMIVVLLKNRQINSNSSL